MRHALLLCALAPAAFALPRDPAVSRTHVAFVEAGQIWTVPRTGGAAKQVTNTPGPKAFVRFSPDGSQIAFTSGDVHVVPARGGTPLRATYLPAEQVVTQWTRHDHILFYSRALSFSPIEMQIFSVTPAGGLPVQLPPVYGSDGTIDDSGTWLAYTPQWPTALISRWKTYRGGAAPDIWLLNLRTGASRRLTQWAGADLRPMWQGRTLYYVSDEGAEERLNIWAYDMTTSARRQITHYRDYDVRNASIGPGAIVFELGPDIMLLDLPSGKASTVRIATPTPPLVREVDASRFVTFTESAGGTTMIEARGDIWIAPNGGKPRNLTATSGAFEREAALRPDGRAIAYWSDATGEYQLYIRGVDDAAAPPPLTSYATGFRYRPVWSPDGRRLAFAEQTGAIVIFDVDRGQRLEVDTEPWNAGIEPAELAWSSDSAALIYTKTAPNRATTLWRFDVAAGTRAPMTSDMFNAGTPVFDAAGKRLFFISYRNFANATFDWMQHRVAHRATAALMMVPLDGPMDVESIERRAVRLPVTAGSITALEVTPDGNPTYSLLDLGGKSSVRVYDIAKKSESVVAEGTTEIRPASFDKSAMKTRIDLRAEWRELLDDAARLYRDFFFAPKVAPIDWQAVKNRYAPMIARCVSREEVHLVLAEMIGQSGVGHAYVGRRGDVAEVAPNDAAALGADIGVDRGAFRLQRIVRAAPFDDTVRAPLQDARDGEYLLAINGVKLDVRRDPRAALIGLAGKEVTITVGPNPVIDDAVRTITVVPLASENEMRLRAWVEANRRRVDEASGGRAGYVHIPDFTLRGFNEFARQFYGQLGKDALIIDARWSQGGSMGAVIAELLARRPLNAAASRYSKEAYPAQRSGAHFGKKALLVSHMTVSAGENFSFYFRKFGIGPIVGERTWGGLTGLNRVPSLIDGGTINVPNAPFFDETGWLIEGHGLEPDVPVERDPANPVDAQLERAVREVTR